MAVDVRADPDVGPRRRNGEGGDTSPLRPAANQRAVRLVVGEPASHPPAGDTGFLPGHIPEAGGLGGRSMDLTKLNAHGREGAMTLQGIAPFVFREGPMPD